MKGNRRKGRQDALQILYQLDSNNELSPQQGLLLFERCFTPASAIDDFGQRLVQGVTTHLAAIDAKIQEVSEHWRKDRMPVVDRNILRIGVFELHHCMDIPATVTINEMVELAKEFGAENSAGFVNGLLDKVKSKLDSPDKAK